MKITYKLHDSQYRIFNDDSRFVVLAAGRRFGKTVLAIVKMITKALETKKALIWYVAPTYKQAKMIAWEMLLEMTPKNLIAKKNEVELQIVLINGSAICLKGADNEDSLRGAGLDFAVLDEYASMKPNVWQEIIRPMLSDRQAPALFIGTPKGKNHFWELFVKGERKQDGFSSYRMKTVDNPYIPRSEVKEAEGQLNERYFRQEYEASFEDFTGLIWPEYDPKIHLIEPFEIPGHWETVAAIDTAVSGTTAVLLAAIDEDGKIFIVKEYYEQNKRVSEVCDVIKSWNPKQWLIDPAAKIRNQRKHSNGDLYSLYDEYADNGIYATPAENEVYGGINRVAEYYKTGKLNIFKGRCPNLEAETLVYHWAEQRELVSGTSKPMPFKSFDHAVDSKRYIVASRPSFSKHPEKKLKKNTAAYLEEMERLQEESV